MELSSEAVALRSSESTRSLQVHSAISQAALTGTWGLVPAYPSW